MLKNGWPGWLLFASSAVSVSNACAVNALLIGGSARSALLIIEDETVPPMLDVSCGLRALLRVPV